MFSVTKASTFIYTVTATSASGCTATTSVTLTVVAVRCGQRNDKVVVCHQGHELCLSPNAVNTHLTGCHGDRLGACSATAARAAAPLAAAAGSVTELAVYPNPAVDQATVSFRIPLDGNAQVVVYNASGQRVASLYEDTVNDGQRASTQQPGPHHRLVRVPLGSQRQSQNAAIDYRAAIELPTVRLSRKPLQEIPVGTFWWTASWKRQRLPLVGEALAQLPCLLPHKQRVIILHQE